MFERSWPVGEAIVSPALVAQVCEIEDVNQMAVAIAALLIALIPSDVVWRTRLDVVHHSADVLVSEGQVATADPRLSRSLAAVGTKHPAVASYLADPTNLTPRRVSDVCGGREWLDSPAFRRMPDEHRGRHQLSMVTRLTPATGEGWVLMRHRRDFSDADVEEATRTLPVLVALDRLLLERRGPTLAQTPVGALSAREHQVLTLVAAGLTAAAVGRRLGIAPGTVRKHLERVYDKLGTHDRLNAVTYAREVGILDANRSSGSTWRRGRAADGRLPGDQR